MSKDVLELMVEAGLVPETVLQEFKNWGLLEGKELPAPGTVPLSTTPEAGKQTHKDFAKRLALAAERSATRARQTSLNAVVRHETATFRFHGGEEVMAFVGVDSLGRYITPSGLLKPHDRKMPRKVVSVRPQESSEFLAVRRSSPMFEGDDLTETLIEVERNAQTPDRAEDH